MKDYGNEISSLAIELRHQFRKIREGFNQRDFDLHEYGRSYKRLESMAPLMPIDHANRSHLVDTLEQFTVNDLSGLDAEELSSINLMGELIKDAYLRSKHEGREVKSLLRSILLAGKFPANYMAEFERRF